MGEPRGYTRATTIAGTLADRYGLEKWGNRNVVLGIAARPDLYALAASCTADDKQQLQKIVDQAQEAAKAQSGANLGTALHRLTERIDSGELLDVPDAWKPDIDAYCQTLADAHISIDLEWMERVVLIPEFSAAGTLDRLVTIDNGSTYMVADLKTGKDVVSYGMNDIAIQLALYANATHAWVGDAATVPRDQWDRYLLPDPEESGAYDPMPEVNQEKALVIHLPAGRGECHLYEVDIKAGLGAARLALDVREWRNRDDLSNPFQPKGGHLQLVSDDW
jgi:hypothetical protein